MLVWTLQHVPEENLTFAGANSEMVWLDGTGRDTSEEKDRSSCFLRCNGCLDRPRHVIALAHVLLLFDRCCQSASQAANAATSTPEDARPSTGHMDAGGRATQSLNERGYRDRSVLWSVASRAVQRCRWPEHAQWYMHANPGVERLFTLQTSLAFQTARL